ncbi:hypothetical protein KVT40_006696 [Elsinoe batatas]|uniref:Major facilitator superfamily (MFS) profile domain-containing protein n=1 Tax=Elsinoe batatas TaxID=2601811 RepID=A0A8K0PAS3_9PEZI|nr:hypothetical protein KVT40_006696 [Elsinoe batatas]
MGKGKQYFGLRGFPLNLAIGVIAGMDFLYSLFGYDQGVMGGILTMDSFFRRFPTIDAEDPPMGQTGSYTSTLQGIVVSSYNLGCFAGAVLTIWVGEKLGRKKTIFTGTWLMIAGATIQAASFGIPELVVGRIITGIGNGMNTSTVPMWQSETSKSHRRGQMVMVEGSLITCGIMLSYWIDYGFAYLQPSEISWRFPLAFQLFFCIIIRDEEAKVVLSALHDKDIDDPYVQSEYAAIYDTAQIMSQGSFRDCFTMDKDRNFHRVVLAYVNQIFQQISGINLITYYSATIYRQSLGLDVELSRLLAALNGTEYFLAAIVPIFIIEKVGRRKLMIFGAAGMSISMAVLAGTTTDASNSRLGVAAAVFLFVFNTFFAIGWLGMTWLVPSELLPLRIRAPGNALATSANWIWNFMVVMITPIAFQNIEYRTYIIFAVINAAIVPSVYFFYPESAYRSLEEMDEIFHKTTGPFDVVRHARETPRRYGKKGELLVNYIDTKE